MNVEFFFKAVSYTLISAGFLTLALTGRVDVISVVLYAAALVASWNSDKPGSRLQISPTTANVLVFAYIPFAFIDFLYLTANWIAVLIHFTLFISIFKLFQRKEDRDWVFLYLLAIFEVLLAAGLTVDAVFVLMLVVFILSGLATLEAFEIRRSQRTVREKKGERTFSHDGKEMRKPVRAVRYLIVGTGVMSLLIVAISVPLFFVIPRFNTGLLARNFGDTALAMTGFSDTVELGDVTSIKKGERTVMFVRVQGRDSSVPRSRWRGVALSTYANNVWRKPASLNRRNVPRDARGYFQIDNRRVTPDQTTAFTFYLEPMNAEVLFAAGKPLILNSQLQVLSRDSMGSLYTTYHSTDRLVYNLVSDTSLPSIDALRRDSGAYSEGVRREYLQLPDEFDPRIRKLAADVAGPASTAYDKAAAIENYLRTRFAYSLQINRTPDEKDPLADFLFNTQKGYCEYFASAMTLMLRSQGIPARLVNGFQPGQYNEVAGGYSVKQSDAHSWVEVYFPDSRTWIEFDPTPSDESKKADDGFVARINRYIEALRLFYVDYVVAYDADRQRSLAREAGQTLVGLQIKFRRWFEGVKEEAVRKILSFDTSSFRNLKDPRNSGTFLTGLLAAVALLIGWRGFTALRRAFAFPETVFESWWKRLLLLPWIYRLARGDLQKSSVLYYHEMLVVLGRAGFRRETHQTPLEFAARVNLPEVVALTTVYNRARFGGEEKTAGTPKLMRDMLDNVRASLKRRKR